MAPLIGLTLLLCALTPAVARAVGVSGEVSYSLGLTMGYLSVSSLALVAFLIFLGRMAIAREPNPIARCRELARIQMGAWIIIFFSIPIVTSFYSAIASMKVLIPHVATYWADPALAAIDRALFFGIDPWRVTHALFGPTSTWLIDLIYTSWIPYSGALLIFLMVCRDRRIRAQGLLAYLLCWVVLGGMLAVGLASVGPCFYSQFYGDPYFQPLMANLAAVNDQHPLVALKAMARLEAEYQANSLELGAGISAMPSLHVSITMLGVLVARHYGRFWRLSAQVYLSAILVGSVHLGWHYLVDGIVSIAGTILIWKAVGLYLDAVGIRDRGGDDPVKVHTPANAVQRG